MSLMDGGCMKTKNSGLGHNCRADGIKARNDVRLFLIHKESDLSDVRGILR
jgi:hypothetical protein